MQTQEFIEKYKMKMKAESISKRSDGLMDEDMDHWRCVIYKCDDKGMCENPMTIEFSMGYGHQGEKPGIADVLRCLYSEYFLVINTDCFEDFCDEIGGNPDSIKEKRCYDIICRQTAEFKQLLGDAVEDFESIEDFGIIIAL